MRFMNVVALVVATCAVAHALPDVGSLCDEIGATPAQCCSVCTTVVSDVKDGDCDSVSKQYAIANYVEGEAPSVNHETIVTYVGELCEKAKPYMSELGMFSPQQACSFLDACTTSRRRRAIDSERQQADIAELRELAERLHMTVAEVRYILEHHASLLSAAGAPVAVYSDGSMGYCSADPQTGLFTCIESNSQVRLPRYSSQVSLGAAPSSSDDSDTKTAVVVVGVVLGALLVVSLVILGLMWSRQSRMGSHTVLPIPMNDGLGERLL